MNWKNLFSLTSSLKPDQARKLIETSAPDEVQVLDVRQPKEYEAGHLPGARLIPIKELPDRLAELDRAKPVVAYCAVGGRSRAAAQYLSGKGFEKVHNLLGGIKAWQGGQAFGPESAGLELLPAGADYDDAAALAFAMEDGLQRFYHRLAAASGDTPLGRTYQRLAGFEEGHKARLTKEYRARTGRDLKPAGSGELIEGGRTPAEPAATTPAEALEEAMGLEFQAQDLYQRLAQRSEAEAGRELFLALAAEEKEHLSFLERELERLPAD
ncbi:rhodanese-like domain-containing protein [Desulfurivibrio sp. C05AmB]|uniref:rhodanese-like domain-containing protein n=1 Tax=Desulfurivibrio sp. C05AmB TaxID=3374371 RepID=UPI00376F39F8